MNKRLLLFLAGFLPGFHPGSAGPYGLPPKAKILEIKEIRSKTHPGRALMLWMVDPEKVPYWGDPEDPYTCPDETAGSHYRGPARVSLVDTARKKVIHTIKILNPVITGEEGDALSIPYEIRAGYYYHVQAKAKQPGRPTLLWLKDYNGDGKAQEFALFHKLNCSVVWTTLIGYSERQDRAINYPVKLAEVVNGDKRPSQTSYWAAHLFAMKPRRPGKWRYDVGYQDCDAHYEFEYDPKKESFAGREVVHCQ